ncbi:unnamed protein product [Auanema sp. JU1783]|nr:unnamed protein product [Auanema sp. JU1783]
MSEDSKLNSILERAGIHIDELNRLRLLNPEVSEVFVELQTDCKEFTGQLTGFKSHVDSLQKTMEELATLVEAEKLKAMNTRAELKSASRKNMADFQQTQIVIRERQVELERLRAEAAAIRQIEQTQKEYLQQIMEN